MTNLLILGSGGHGSVISELALLSSKYNTIKILDDKYSLDKTLFNDLNLQIIGKLSELHTDEIKENFQEAIVAIGESSKRIKLIKELISNGYEIPILKHPSSIISPYSKIARGTVIMANSVIQAGCEVGLGCIINTGATLDHHSKISDGVHICPGVNLGGNVFIGNNSWIGIGSSVIQKVNIGESVMIGAGSVVVDSVRSNVTVYGNPAKEKLRKR